MVARPFSTLPDFEACNKWKRGYGETSYVDWGFRGLSPIIKGIPTCTNRISSVSKGTPSIESRERVIEIIITWASSTRVG